MTNPQKRRRILSFFFTVEERLVLALMIESERKEKLEGWENTKNHVHIPRDCGSDLYKFRDAV